MAEPEQAVYTSTSICRSCKGANILPLFSLGNQWVSDFVCQPLIKAGPRAPVDIDLCRDCGLVQARHSVRPNLLYRRNYWYRSGVSQTMRDALRDVAGAVEREAGLVPGDVVLDIGSNDGTLLRSYSVPGLTHVGFEPAPNLREEGSNGVEVFCGDFWNADTWDRRMTTKATYEAPRTQCQAKAITALGMLYDLEDPNPFVADVARVLAPDGVFCAQLMCLQNMIDCTDIGNFAHEHLEFYSLRSLDDLLGRHGLYIYDLEENAVNGRSYRLWIKHLEANRPRQGMAGKRWIAANRREAALGDADTYRAFWAKCCKSRDDLRSFLTGTLAKGRRTYIIGASTKGNTILQFCGLDDLHIDGAMDRSPEKWGLFTAGTGIQIVSEEEGRRAMPDYCLVLPYAFAREIVERERDAEWRRRGGKFIIPLPEFRVV
jgi:SAM-dependent methyltransferase